MVRCLLPDYSPYAARDTDGALMQWVELAHRPSEAIRARQRDLNFFLDAVKFFPMNTDFFRAIARFYIDRRRTWSF